jgi:hypothetical protein
MHHTLETACPVSPARTSHASPAPARWRPAPRTVSEHEVLTAVVDLSRRYHAPSTSLITWQLARDGTVTSAFQSAVRDRLQHLRASGQLSCVTHRGTHRWSATIDRHQASA